MDKKPTLKLKSLACALLAAVMVFSFAGCKDRGEPSESSSSESSSMVEEPSQDPGDPSEPEKETLDKIAAAQAHNSDVVGWLTIPNTTIDAEVLQKVGDNVYYERRDITQKYNWYGCYYADGGNTFGTRNDLTKNTIIYGHNMNDGSMFADIAGYTQETYWREHPIIQCDSLTRQREYEVMAVLQFKDSEQAAQDYYSVPCDEMNFTEYISRLADAALYDTGIQAVWGDQILALSTCSRQDSDSRILVIARKTGL